MTKMSADERRQKLGSSRDKSLKRFDDVFPDDLTASSFRPRLSLIKRSASSPWEDPLPRVREESEVQEVSAEEKRKPLRLRRRHTWNLGVRIPSDVSNRLRTIPLKPRPVSSESSSSSVSSLDVEASDDEVASVKKRQGDTCKMCGNQMPELDKNLNFIERSLNESSDTDDDEDTDEGIVCRPSLLYCMSCRITRDAIKHRPLSRENSVPEDISVSRSPTPLQADIFRLVVSDVNPLRRSSFTELSELPSIQEPAGEDLDSYESRKAKQVVQDELEKLVNFNRNCGGSRTAFRRSTIGSPDDIKKLSKIAQSRRTSVK